MVDKIEIILKSQYFNAEYYANECGMFDKNSVELAEHYLNEGWKLGYNPSEEFNTKLYLYLNYDVKEAGINPLFHYEVSGKNAGRRKAGSVIDYRGNYIKGFYANGASINTCLQIETPVRLKEVRIAGPRTTKIGAFTYIERDCLLHGVSSIGRFCSIAENCVLWDNDHSIYSLSTSPYFSGRLNRWVKDYCNCEQNPKQFEIYLNSRKKYLSNVIQSAPITIGNDVWIGNGAKVLKNVHVGDGAVIGAGAIVTKDVPPYAVVAGNPAKIIKKRFSDQLIKRLLKIKWWDYGPDVVENLEYANVEATLDAIEERIENGFPKYIQDIIQIDPRAVSIDKLV